MDATETRQFLLDSYAILVPSSILIYDHVATLPEEIDFIWCHPKALSAILFLVNRYLAFSNIFALAVNFLPISDQGCSIYERFRPLFFFVQQMIVCLILTLRIYALYGRSKHLLSWMAMISLVLVGIIFVGYFRDHSDTATDIQGSDCHQTGIYVRNGAAWIAMFGYELLIFVLTVFRTCKTRGLPRLSLISRKNILDIIFQDGAMYFAAMTLVNLPNMLMYFRGSVDTRGSLATFTSCMSVTLISRLMLNLHKSIDTGIFSTPARDDPSLAVLTSRVNVQSAISSHHW